MIDPGFLLDLPPVWAHDGTLHMAKKGLVKLGWETDSQSSKKLKLKVVKPGEIGLDLAGGGLGAMQTPRNSLVFPQRGKKQQELL